MQIPDVIIATDGSLFDHHHDATYVERLDNLVMPARTLHASEIDPDILVFFGDVWHLDASGGILIAYGIDSGDVRDSVRRIQRPGDHRSAAANAELQRRSEPELEAFTVVESLTIDGKH